LLLALCLGGVTSLPAQVAVTEFLASNDTGLRDDDGDLSGWIELENTNIAPANLEGWFLTDSRSYLSRWRFPATNLTAKGRFILFASGKNRTQPGAPLHTNFRLSTAGGFLALVKPDGRTVASSFTYLNQFPDISFGLGLGPSLMFDPLVAPGTAIKYCIPTGPLDEAWRGGAYTSPYGVGQPEKESRKGIRKECLSMGWGIWAR
jgi:hypothetical protein